MGNSTQLMANMHYAWD